VLCVVFASNCILKRFKWSASICQVPKCFPKLF